MGKNISETWLKNWVTTSEWKKKYAKKGSNKFGARRTVVEGISFASAFEASGYSALRARENAGEIRDIECQPRLFLSDARISYRPDFAFTVVSTNERHYAEYKGAMTDRFRLIVKLWKAYGPAPLEIWRGTWKKPYLDQVIIPQGLK